MNTGRVLFAGLSVVLPTDWADVTDDLPSGTPYTLAPQGNSVGALQFSVATYKRGELPKFNTDKLRRMLDEFFKTKGFGHPEEFDTWSDLTFGVGGNYCSDEEFYRIWYVSDFYNIGLITYTALQKRDMLVAREVLAADAIVKSIIFE